MKKNISLFLINFSILFFAQSIDFQDYKFKDLLAKAKKENKLIFLDAYASWCGPCKLLEKNTFPQKDVREFFNANFINTHIDMEKGEGPELAKKYMVRSYPTLFILNGDGEIIQQSLGYLSPEDFLNFGKLANNPINKKGSPKQLFEKGESDPEFLKNIIITNANSDYDFAKKASERYFQVKKDKNFSKEEANFILYFTKSTKDPNYKIFVDQKNEILKLISPELYKQFDNQMKLSEVLANSFDEKTGIIKEDYFYENAIPLVGKDEATKSLNRLKINLYQQVGNYKGYESAALDYYKNPDDFQNNELDKAAWIFAQNITNPDSLKKAQVWAEKSVMRAESIENTYVLAKLYQKTGNIDGAKMFAQESVNLALAQGKDASFSRQLLNELNNK